VVAPARSQCTTSTGLTQEPHACCSGQTIQSEPPKELLALIFPGEAPQLLEELEQLGGVCLEGRGKALAGKGKEVQVLGFPGLENGLELKACSDLDGEF
jgi:hypothetical protein